MRRKWRKNKQHLEVSEDSGQTQASMKIDHAFASSGESSRGFSHLFSGKSKPAPAAKSHMSSASAKPGKRKFRLNRTGKQVLVVIVVLAVGAGVMAIMKRDTSPPTPVAAGCSNGVLQEAVAAFTPDRLERLGQISDKIKQLPGYDQDPNCLYVVLIYYINTSDGPAAGDYLSKLEKVYDPSKGYASALKISHAKSPQELHSIVDFLQEQSKQKFSPSGVPL